MGYNDSWSLYFSLCMAISLLFSLLPILYTARLKTKKNYSIFLHCSRPSYFLSRRMAPLFEHTTTHLLTNIVWLCCLPYSRTTLWLYTQKSQCTPILLIQVILGFHIRQKTQSLVQERLVHHVSPTHSNSEKDLENLSPTAEPINQ